MNCIPTEYAMIMEISIQMVSGFMASNGTQNRAKYEGVKTIQAVAIIIPIAHVVVPSDFDMEYGNFCIRCWAWVMFEIALCGGR